MTNGLPHIIFRTAQAILKPYFTCVTQINCTRIKTQWKLQYPPCISITPRNSYRVDSDGHCDDQRRLLLLCSFADTKLGGLWPAYDLWHSRQSLNCKYRFDWKRAFHPFCSIRTTAALVCRHPCRAAIFSLVHHYATHLLTTTHSHREWSKMIIKTQRAKAHRICLQTAT